MRRNSFSAALTAAALLAAAGIPGVQVVVDGSKTTLREANNSTPKPAQPATSKAAAQDYAALDWRRFRATNRSGYPNGPGWSNRHVQRMARKKRNQARHRKACR